MGPVTIMSQKSVQALDYNSSKDILMKVSIRYTGREKDAASFSYIELLNNWIKLDTFLQILPEENKRLINT